MRIKLEFVNISKILLQYNPNLYYFYCLRHHAAVRPVPALSLQAVCLKPAPLLPPLDTPQVLQTATMYFSILSSQSNWSEKKGFLNCCS